MKLLKPFALALLLAAAALAQQQPAPKAFVAAGAGISSAKTSGWFAFGHLTNDPSSAVPLYLVFQATPSGLTNAASGSVFARVWSSSHVWLAAEGGAGVATAADAVGSFLQFGGVVGFRIPKHENFSVVYKPAAVKLTVGGNGLDQQHLFGLLWRFDTF